MDDPFELFEEDDVIFHHILAKLYSDFNAGKTNRVEDLEDVFGEGISDYVFRLKEKGYIDFVTTTKGDITFHFLDINDQGIEAFKTIYDPDTINRNVEMAAQEVLEEVDEKKDKKQHREKVFLWIKIGVIISGIFSLAALIISIFAYVK